jgi:hypothetical protein
MELRRSSVHPIDTGLVLSFNLIFLAESRNQYFSVLSCVDGRLLRTKFCVHMKVQYERNQEEQTMS